ncbi:uncharacterized protein LOC126194074 [Schistocerca nitens]|uniref:uncharacterized protein LOC126194074 n=1 Tax=Schistocerca nitens TaxID=7011 RepID=UPI002118EAD8|nr:uncharacterized protein LOC126194074 [Schistocerca nitens]
MYRLLSFAVLLLALHCALAMPNHPASMRMSGELSHEMDMHNDTAANATTTSSSAEDDDDDNADDDATDDEDDDDDEIHVEGKSFSCPTRRPEVVEIEQQCMAEYNEMKKKKKDAPCMAPPTKDIFVIQKEAPNAATIRLETVPDTASSEETTHSPGHKHRAHMSFYYHCLLKKLDWLNEAGVPSKSKIEAWLATNVTDATQREQTKKQVNHCLIESKDETEGTESSTESTEETEKSTESSSKMQDQMKCDFSKTLLCCLNHVECPIVKYP